VDEIVIQSHGLGVESQAILENWHYDPTSRPFKDWSQLIVVTAQVGEEHKNDTVPLAEARMLPILREHKVRFVELARRGHLEEDGIVILQDTREPWKLNPDGVYKLSDELLHSGTVPQFGGEHRCAMKFKAFPIETWLAYEFQNRREVPVHHVFGYNADETTRISKSDLHITRHNSDREIIHPGKSVLEVFGFNSEEGKRIERSRKYDGPVRTGAYPLQAWGWNRQKCLDFIKERSGLDWKKSHCSFCPFCAEATKGEEGAVKRWHDSPEQTAHGLMVEHNSMSFNFRGHLYRDRALIDVIRAKNVTPVLEIFERKLDAVPWGLYHVRRIYTAKGKAIRCVQPILKGTRNEMLTELLASVNRAPWWKWFEQRKITYLMTHEREPEKYPTREAFYVAAPAFMELKLRGPVEVFDERWDRVGRGLPMNPGKNKIEEEELTT
jgi:hypothetical protein